MVPWPRRGQCDSSFSTPHISTCGGKGKVGYPSTVCTGLGTCLCVEKVTLKVPRMCSLSVKWRWWPAFTEGHGRNWGPEEPCTVGRLEQRVENTGSYKAVVLKESSLEKKIQRIMPRVATTDICLDKKGLLVWDLFSCCNMQIADGRSLCRCEGNRHLPQQALGPCNTDFCFSWGRALYFILFVALWEIFYRNWIFLSGSQWQNLNQEQWEQSRMLSGHCEV